MVLIRVSSSWDQAFVNRAVFSDVTSAALRARSISARSRNFISPAAFSVNVTATPKTIRRLARPDFCPSAERGSATLLEAPRHVDHPQAIGQRLLASWPHRNARMRPTASSNISIVWALSWNSWKPTQKPVRRRMRLLSSKANAVEGADALTDQSDYPAYQRRGLAGSGGCLYEQSRRKICENSVPCRCIGQVGFGDGHGMSRNLSRGASCGFGFRRVRSSS